MIIRYFGANSAFYDQLCDVRFSHRDEVLIVDRDSQAVVQRLFTSATFERLLADGTYVDVTDLIDPDTDPTGDGSGATYPLGPSLPGTTNCPVCDGSGEFSNSPFENCPTCDGEGVIGAPSFDAQ